jgi:hypothetical protein
MWNFLRRKTTCPVETSQKEWIDYRFSWLADEFGVHRPKTAPVILPTPEFFPDPCGGTAEDVPPLFGRVCTYLGLEPTEFRLRIYTEEERPLFPGESRMVHGTAGLYQRAKRPIVSVNASQLADLPALVATLIHESCHDLLLGAGRLTGDEPDHELVTDLLTVYLGLGIITANATIRESNWHSGGWEGWRVGRQGYLTQNMYGYALALYARARAEAKPGWLRHLRPDVRVPCKQAIRYLAETGDTPAASGQPC